MGKIALVTGSSRGIGRAIAAHLARDGWAVCINYIQRRDCAEELAALAIVLYDKLGFADETDGLVPVSGTGGVFKIGPAVTEPFARILRAHGMEYVEPATTPDMGALMLAIKHDQSE